MGNIGNVCVYLRLFQLISILVCRQKHTHEHTHMHTNLYVQSPPKIYVHLLLPIRARWDTKSFLSGV